MKALGIVRKMDDLGRVVIPIEVRREQKLEPQDPIEMFTTDDGLMLRPYRRNEEFEEAIHVIESFAKEAAAASDNDFDIETIQNALNKIKKNS